MTAKPRMVGLIASAVLVLFSLFAMGEANDSLLASLGEIAILVEGEQGGCPGLADAAILNPYIFPLEVQDILVDKNRYPRARDMTLKCDDPTVNLALIVGYCDYVQRTQNRSALMVYTSHLFDDSFVLLDAIKSVSVAGQIFDPEIPVLVWSSHDVIDYTNCTCGSREYHIFAIPMPEHFLLALEGARSEVRIVMAPHPIFKAGTDTLYVFHNESDLNGYINFINGL